jgi:hypothetical protein
MVELVLINLIVLSINNKKMAIKTGNLDKDLQKIECYLGNVQELVAQTREKFIDPETGQLVDVDLKVAIQMINELTAKFIETASECEGKQLAIDWPDGIAWTILRTILASIGLNLPIK